MNKLKVINANGTLYATCALAMLSGIVSAAYLIVTSQMENINMLLYNGDAKYFGTHAIIPPNVISTISLFL
jgi:hypothetical protein